jgi:hypothetical protein
LASKTAVRLVVVEGLEVDLHDDLGFPVLDRKRVE